MENSARSLSPAIVLTLLGTYEITVDGALIDAPPTAKGRSLLAYLALRRGEAMRRDVLMAEFWPDASPESARNNLKTTLSTLRGVFKRARVEADDILVISRDTVSWVAQVTIDADAFKRSSIAHATERERAIKLHHGQFSPDDQSEWATETRDRLSAHFEDLLRAELAVHPSVDIAERLLLLDPFCDAAYVALIEDALRNDAPRAAQAVYRRYAAALAEVGTEPPAELARRVGDQSNVTTEHDIGFVGRTDELAELRAWLADETAPPVLIVSGIAGIGKAALIAEATRIDTAFANVATIETVAEYAGGRAMLCVRPDALTSALDAFPNAPAIALGPLTRAEVALALQRRFSHDDVARLADGIWSRCEGHPFLLEPAIAQQSFSREILRHFTTQLRAAGEDAERVAELLALEPALDSDDLVVLLDWSNDRVSDVRQRLASFGILTNEEPARFSFSIFSETALRSLSPARRKRTIERIAERLALHEHPSAKIRLAEHFVTLGREREAAAAYLEAGRNFVAFAAWRNALDAFDAGIALLDRFATSPAAVRLLSSLHLMRGDALYQSGGFAASVRSLNSVLDMSTSRQDASLRASALVTMGHALLRLNQGEAAWSVARKATNEARSAGDVHEELEATNLMARLHFNATNYSESIECARAGFERAMEASEWIVAAALAQRAADGARRQLKFADCFMWVQHQIRAGILAGPLVEAQAHYVLGSVEYAVNRLDRAADEAREGLHLIDGIRRQHTLSVQPLGQLEWSCHQALAHTYTLSGALDDALAECDWLVRSPWLFNATSCSAMTLATVVDVRLAANTERDVQAAVALADRIPSLPPTDPAAFLDYLTRARIAARTGAADAVVLLHQAFASIERAEAMVPDQIHLSYRHLAEAARGIDDILGARAAELARKHRQRVVEAAGELWGRPA